MRVFVLLILSTLLAVPATAQAPRTIAYQGVLADGGVPVSSSTSLNFSLFGVATGGGALWTETQTVTPDASGAFSVQLGSVSTLDEVTFGAPLWLGLSVGGTAMGARTELAAVPFALGLYGLRTRPAPTAGGAPNVIGGHPANTVGEDLSGATISGGGSVSSGAPVFNEVTASWGTISGGAANRAEGSYATVGGGYGNKALTARATIGGGQANTADGDRATVGGGWVNRAQAPSATVGGGRANVASSENATIGGGMSNQASGGASGVSAGESNVASGDHGIVAGGLSNEATGVFSGVSAGTVNRAIGEASAVGGGRFNRAEGLDAVVGGGRSNQATGINSSVAGGRSNDATEQSASVGGGRNNTASASTSRVGGGFDNRASGSSSVIGGGLNNSASGDRSTVAGGRDNKAVGENSSVLGGYQNEAHGDGGSVLGGRLNRADGKNSLAAGARAKAIHDNTFVWADRDDPFFPTDFASTAPSQFLIRAANGVGINTSGPLADVHVQSTDNGLQGSALLNESLVVEDGDAVLGLYSDDSGNWGSAISLGEVDANGALVTKWGIVRRTTGQGPSLNFTFGTGANYASNNTLMRIDANGTVRADGSFVGGGADFAEYFPLAPASSRPRAGDVVGIRGGTVGLATGGAEQVMVISSDPAFVGNPDAESGGALVALVGQVEVRLASSTVGSAQVGDLLVASGQDNGTARSVSPARYSPSADGPVLGRVLELVAEGRAIALVGVDESAALRAVVQRQAAELAGIRDELARMKGQLDRVLQAVSAIEAPSGAPSAR